MKADEIVILGKAEGKLSCQSLTLHFSAIVKANAAYVNLRIEAGAQFEGNFAKPKSLAAPKS
jgi:cytoskeletal protein CcmA (bactofilin family)